MPIKPIYQLKITLIDSRPPIWRRIQVKDCTLDELHTFIQTAMGWENAHLHRFEINGERYGDPRFLDDDFGEFRVIDSLQTELSEILPSDEQPFAFLYVYDFGDYWVHEVQFESPVKAEIIRQPPICLEGERACPPEDVGGIWGYKNSLEAITDPDHEEHEHYVEWGAGHDPEVFNVEETTERMREELG